MTASSATVKTSLAVMTAAAALAAAPFAQASPRGNGNSRGNSGNTPAATRGAQSAQGLVQSVSTKSVVLRRLDGTAVTVPIDGKTQLFVDGKGARLSDIKPGYVVTASWAAGKTASSLHFLRSS